MIKDIGRLEPSQIRDVEAEIEEIFSLLDKKKDKAVAKIEELSNTTNFFLRELVGKLLTNYHNLEKMEKIASDMLQNKNYGTRATALFFFYNLSGNNPDKLVTLLEENYENIPWEVENIIYEMWRKRPDIMKKTMPQWLDSPIEKKRIVSFHGLELIADKEPIYILDFLAKAIDDESLEVQKKITHILMQIVRSRPAETYPYIRDWIMTAPDKRYRSLMMSLRKIVSMYQQKSTKDKSQDFMILTKHILFEWRGEPNRRLAGVGTKLSQMLRTGNSNGNGNS